MQGRGLRALVLCALLSRVVFPLFHVHDDEGHDCCHGPAVEAAHAECAICELLALRTPGLEPAPAPRVGPPSPATGECASEAVDAPRAASFWVVCGPRGPPASSPA